MTVETIDAEQSTSRISKIMIGAMLAVALLVLGLLIMVRLQSKPTPKDVTSKGGRITLSHVTPGMELHNNSPLAGKYRPSDGVTMYYMVTAKNHKAVGAGNILPSKGNSFSRNLTLTTKGHSSETGQLEVYLQNTQGKRLDSVTLPVTIQ